MDEKTVNEENKEAPDTAAQEKAAKTEKKEIAKLTEELDKAKSELAALNDKYLRMMAEYDNYRKRSGKEREGVYADAYGDALPPFFR